MDMNLAYTILGSVLGGLFGYSVLTGVFFSIFVKYGWFNHTQCSYNCDRYQQNHEEKATITNRKIGAFFWPIFVVPLIFGWLVLVSRAVASVLLKKKSDFPTAKVVEKD